MKLKSTFLVINTFITALKVTNILQSIIQNHQAIQMHMLSRPNKLTFMRNILHPVVSKH